MLTSEPDSTREATERVFKILNNTYAKSDLDNVAASVVQIYKNQCKKLSSLLKEVEDLFDGTLVKWDTTPVDLEVKTGYEPLNAIYCMVQNTNKETFVKEPID